jgi:hypothetical protein
LPNAWQPLYDRIKWLGIHSVLQSVHNNPSPGHASTCCE